MLKSNTSPDNSKGKRPAAPKAADKAYAFIYSKILNGTLSPGAKLTMRKMATLAGVSVIPVIEALNRLVEDGLVEARPQWGYFVSIPTRNQVEGQLMLREAVECQVARLLHQQLKPASRKSLLNAAKRLDRIRREFTRSGKGSEKEIERTHYEFHMRMAELTGYQTSVETLRRIELFFILLKADPIQRQHHLPEDWHQQLAERIIAGPIGKAEAAMRRHVRDSYESILANVPEDRSQFQE